MKECPWCGSTKPSHRGTIVGQLCNSAWHSSHPQHRSWLFQFGAAPGDSPRTSEPCFHSALEPGCLSCLEGEAFRLRAHIDRLRQLLVDAGASKALTEHDEYWLGSNAPPLPEPSNGGKCPRCCVPQTKANGNPIDPGWVCTVDGWVRCQLCENRGRL